jgi:hypothetical protein
MYGNIFSFLLQPIKHCAISKHTTFSSLAEMLRFGHGANLKASKQSISEAFRGLVSKLDHPQLG